MREPLISATFILDSDEVLLEAMGDGEVFVGIDLKSALNRPLAEVNPELDRMLRGLLEKAGRGRGIENYALAYKVDKRLVPLRASAIPYPLAALGKTGILVSLVSMEEKAARSSVPPQEREVPLPLPGMAQEREVAREEDLAAVADPLFILDQGGEITFANLPFQKLLDAGWEELRSSHLSSWLASGEPRKVVEQIIDTVRLAPWRGELQLRTRAGRDIWLSLTFSPLKEKKGRPGGVLGCAKDFTELRHLWRDREAEETRLAGLLERAACGLFAFTPDGRVTFWNRETERLLSLSADRAVGMVLEDILGVDNGERMRESVGRASSAQGQAETVLPLPGRHGRERFLRVRAVALDTGERGETEYVAALEDITETEGLAAGAERADRAMEFLARCAALSSQAKSPEDLLAGFLGEVEDLSGAAAGAVWRIEEEYVELRSHRGYSEGFAQKAARLRIRPSRLEMLEAQAGQVLDLLEVQAPDDTTSLRVLFRDWDIYRQAHLEEGHNLQVLLPWKTGGEVVGMLVLAGFSSPQVDEEHLRAVVRALPWLSPAMDRPAGGEAPSPLLDDESRSSLAHELSTPLTYVRGFTQLLVNEREQLDPQALQEVIDNIDTGTARMVEALGRYLPHSLPDDER